jgi:hypothetical protein
LDDQVLLTSNLTPALKLALNILPHGSGNENIFAKVATAIAFSQIVNSLIRLYPSHGLATFNISESNRSCAAVVSEAGVGEGRFSSATSGRR